MMKFQIQLNSIEDVIRMVNHLEQYEQPVDAKIGSYMVDATSLMGLISMGLGKKVELLVHGDVTENFHQMIHEFQ